jgi:Protein of unknown function (DUF4232)
MRIPGSRSLSRRTRLVVSVAALVSALAGCGSTTTTSGAPQAPPASSDSTTTPVSSTHTGSASTSSTSSTSTTTAATPTGGPGTCRAAELVLTYLGGQGATGHGDLGFALRNRGPRTCHTEGYPGIQFLDANGKPLPTHPTHNTDDFFGHSPLRALTVAPGHEVSFRLDVSHGSGSPGQCPTAAALEVIPPGDTHTLSTSITNGAYECGRAIVSPLEPGLSAHP